MGLKKGCPIIHDSVDIKKKKIVSLDVTSEEVHDITMLNKLVNNALKTSRQKSNCRWSI